MTAPQYPQGYAPQQYPQPGYPAPPEGYAPQQFQQPQYAPPPAYPQGYPQPGYPQAAPPAMAAGSLDAFYNQPSTGGGPALKFEVNTTHVGIVARPITNADIQQQTNPQNQQPAFFRDGRPKFVMKVPMRVQPSQAHPEGVAQWYVAGAARDELVRAMAEAGAPEGPPEAGAGISITCTGTRPSGVGMNPSKTYAIRYQRPNGAAPVAQAPVAQAPVAAPTPPAAPPAPPVAQPVAAAPASLPPAPSEPPAEMSPDQLALLAKLTGQPG